MVASTPPGRLASLRVFAACLREFADRKIFFILLLLVLVTLAEGGSLLTLLPLLQVVGVDSGATADGFAARVLAQLHACHIPLTLPALLAFFLVVSALQAGSRAWLGVLNARLQSLS